MVAGAWRCGGERFQFSNRPDAAPPLVGDVCNQLQWAASAPSGARDPLPLARSPAPNQTCGVRPKKGMLRMLRLGGKALALPSPPLVPLRVRLFSAASRRADEPWRRGELPSGY